MMKLHYCLLGLVALGHLVHGDTCTNPKVDVTPYTPSDAQVLSHIPFIAEFGLACANGAATNLYADVEGVLVPVVKIQGKDSVRYQVSWTREIKHARSGSHAVSIYDDDGYNAVKRVLERGEDMSSVKPLATVHVNYAGAYRGPWVHSEHLAAVLAFLVFYLAYSSKSALLV